MIFSPYLFLAALPLIVPEKLTYISAPKGEISYNGNPSKAERDAHDSYRKLYRRFMIYSGYLEREYDRAGKPAHLKSCIDTMNKLGKSANWKNILSLQPFKVKSGIKNITDTLDKMSSPVNDIIDKEDNANNNANGMQPAVEINQPVKKGVIVSVPEADMNRFPVMTYRRRIYVDSVSSDAKIQEAGLNMMRSNDPAERAKGKQLWRMGLRSRELNRNANQRIKDEARKAGEEWAQD